MTPDELNERSKKTACWSGLDFAVERIEKLEARVKELEKTQERIVKLVTQTDHPNIFRNLPP